MYVYCPHCTRQLKISEAVFASLESLPPEKLLKVQCVHCKQGFQLDRSRVQKESSANREQQPVDMQPQSEESATEQIVNVRSQQQEVRKRERPAAINQEQTGAVRPPMSPDISWLSGGEKVVKQMIKGRPLALLAVPRGGVRDTLVREIDKLNYQVEEATDIDDAIDKIISTPYELVICHSSYEKGGLNVARFHGYVSRLPMNRRHDIFYVLVGEEMKTLYDMQALAYSANLVINDAEVRHIGAFLPKAIEEHREFLQPLLEELRLAGK